MTGRTGSRTKIIWLSAAVVLFAWGLARLSPAANDPLSQVKDAVQEVLRILQDEQLLAPDMKEERRKRVEAVVDTMFDFAKMSKHVLVGYWNERTPEERQRFKNLFARLVKQRYIGKIDNYTGQEVVFKKQRVKGDRALIYTSLIDKGIAIPITYKLFKNGDEWLVFDMKIENVSLVANYRQDFSSIIKKEGFDGLITRMRAKVAEVEAGGK
ncbi:MAG: ABC transporter substrate-binding protein [Desulfobacterales bacterium]|nr:ABC transporter substrate-binding protein [Desulfobacterales bacterium]